MSCPCPGGTPPELSPSCFQHLDRNCSMANVNENDGKCKVCVKFALAGTHVCGPPSSTPNRADEYCNCYGCCKPPRKKTNNNQPICECPSRGKVGTHCDINLWNPSPYSSLYCTSEGCSTGTYSDNAPFDHVMDCNENCNVSRNILLYFIIIVALIVYVTLFIIFSKRRRVSTGTKKSIIIKNNNI